MKRSFTKIGWQEIIENKNLPVMPKGYLTASQISDKIGIKPSRTRQLLRKAREAGTIKAVLGKISNGNITWFYKE